MEDNTVNQPELQTTTDNTNAVDSNPNHEDLERTIEARIREELEKEKQREIDKRVTDAIKKREAKLKAEQQEKERLSKLSAEERFREVQEQKEKELNEKYRELAVKELKLDLVDILTEEKLPLEFREVIDVNKYVEVKPEERKDALKSDLNVFKNTFNSIIDKRVEDIKREYLKGTTPQSMDTKPKKTSEYDKAKKSGDVQAMISAKLFGTNK